MTDIETNVISIIAKRLPPTGKRDVVLSDRIEDLGIDSLGAVEMIFDLEEKFDIEIPFNANESTLEMETVGEIVDAVKKLVGDKS
jgi:acyl carrier protein